MRGRTLGTDTADPDGLGVSAEDRLVRLTVARLAVGVVWDFFRAITGVVLDFAVGVDFRRVAVVGSTFGLTDFVVGEPDRGAADIQVVGCQMIPRIRTMARTTLPTRDLRRVEMVRPVSSARVPV